MQKQIKNMRVNEELSNILLSEVPKGTSHSNWIIDRLARLEAHEKHSKFWIVFITNVSPNQQVYGDPNGIHPVFHEYYRIVDEIPQTNSSHEDREYGWLGTTNDINEFAFGGFATKDAAIEYVVNFLDAREISVDLDPEEYYKDCYTIAKFDEYWFIDDWLEMSREEIYNDIKNMNNDELEKYAEKIEKEANDDKRGILGDIVEYLENLKKEFEN